MASSSSSTSQWKYDVFLSFRGSDTRKEFVSHLYSGLRSKGIYTFKDDQEIKKGDSFPDELSKAIHTSRFAIVVISENYAASFWCLEELREIMEFRAVKGGIHVVPIFYKVAPSDVRYQGGSFGKALADMNHPKKNDQKVSKWKEALTQVSDLEGYDSNTCVDEATMVKDAVREISDKLYNGCYRYYIEDKVGMRSHIESLISLLEMESEEDVRIIGISGMGGVGKTTIAYCLYRQFSRQFEAPCFLNVKENFKQESLLYLQQYFLSAILGIKHIKLANVEAGSHEIKTRLQHQKVFVVLDHVDQVEQLHGLAKDTSWFGPGSRIIITTRDKGLLQKCGVVYTVKCLDKEHALQMFKQIVFKGIPPDGLEELLRRASQLAYGLPSALIYYSELFLAWGIRTKTKEELEEAVRKFEEVPQETIVEILRSSYTCLSRTVRIAFLHIACLFNGDPILRVGTLLDNGDDSIRVLEEKSLVDRSAQGCINMHVIVEQMGKEIVREESKSTLQKQRILWEHLDCCNVLRDETGTNKIEGLAQDMCQMRDVLFIKGSTFKQMPNVKFLKFYTHLGDSKSNLRLLPDAASLPPMLKLLHWDAYPLRTLPSLFSPQHLVELTMRYSKLRFLCNKHRDLNLEELKRLDVSRSKGLRELPDLSSAMKLEELVVEGCEKLKFLKELPQTLKYLNAHGCKSLKYVSLPYNHYIKHLDLSDCSQLNQNEELITHFLTRGQAKLH